MTEDQLLKGLSITVLRADLDCIRLVAGNQQSVLYDAALQQCWNHLVEVVAGNHQEGGYCLGLVELQQTCSLQSGIFKGENIDC